MRIGAFELREPLPQLREPHALTMLRPWVDVGSVGGLALTRLERHMNAQELGKLARPGVFFDFTRYRPVIGTREGRREVTVPNTFVNFAVRDKAPDLVFMHLLEAHANGEDYVDSIVELLVKLGVKRYFLLGGMYDAVPHTRPLLVTGTVAGAQARAATGAAKVEQSTYEGPTTINYLVGNRLQAVGVETASLIVRIPQYVQLEEDFHGAARLLEVLSSIYGFPDTIIDRQRGQAQYQEINKTITARLRPVIQQLERTYDARQTAPSSQEPSQPLSPEVEKFLKEMGERFGQI